LYKSIPVKDFPKFIKLPFKPSLEFTQRFITVLDPNEQAETVQNVFELGFFPSDLIYTAVDGNKFYFSKPAFASDSRLVGFLFYFDVKQKIYYPIFAYRYKSNGGWRFSPGMFNGEFSKGSEVIDNCSYVASTKPALQISHYLDQNYVSADTTLDVDKTKNLYLICTDFFIQNMLKSPSISMYIPVPSNTDSSVLSFSANTRSVYASEYVPEHDFVPSNIAPYKIGKLSMHKVQADEVLNPPNIEQVIMNQASDFPSEFVPDFRLGPINRGKSFHSILQEYCWEQFLAKLNERTIVWTMAYDKFGRVWVDSITFVDSPITKVGIPEETINAGMYNLKPFEYTNKIDYEVFEKYCLSNFLSYSDITPIIDLIPAVQQFRNARSIYRTT
jgi:hypothetical protein